MPKEAGKKSQPYGHPRRVPIERGREVCRCRYNYSYPNQVVTALEQELKKWQAHSADVEAQLSLAHQVNYDLRQQLMEQNESNVTRNTRENTPHPQIEVGESSCMSPNEQGQNINAEGKAKQKECRYCRKANHEEKDCWKKARKCLKCGSTKHQIRDCLQMKESTGQLSQGNPPTRCRYCGKSNHQKSECWKKTGKCLRCGSSKHRIRKCPVIKEYPRPESQINI